MISECPNHMSNARMVFDQLRLPDLDFDTTFKDRGSVIV